MSRKEERDSTSYSDAFEVWPMSRSICDEQELCFCRRLAAGRIYQDMKGN